MNLSKSSISKLASELLELEKKQFSQKLSDKESERWAELVFSVFEKSENSKRNSIRLPLGLQAEILFGSNKQDVMIVASSLTGVSIVGDRFDGMSVGDSISILVKTAKPVSLKCTVANIQNAATAGNSSAGLQLKRDVSEEERQDYYNHVYFPAYISYLESLAAS